jgi:hypothetical protein
LPEVNGMNGSEQLLLKGFYLPLGKVKGRAAPNQKKSEAKVKHKMKLFTF